SIPVTVFPKVYEEYARLLEKDRLILVKGKTSIRERLGANPRAELTDREDEEVPGIVEVHAEEILPLQNSASPRAREPALHVRLARARSQELNLLRALFTSSPGSARLFLHIPVAGREEWVLANLTVVASRRLVEALQGLVGRGEVWVE